MYGTANDTRDAEGTTNQNAQGAQPVADLFIEAAGYVEANLLVTGRHMHLEKALRKHRLDGQRLAVGNKMGLPLWVIELVDHQEFVRWTAPGAVRLHLNVSRLPERNGSGPFS